MGKYFIARYGKIKSERQLKVALQHNQREVIYTGGNIDSTKTIHNYNVGLAGDSQSRLDMCKKLIDDAGVKLRKDAVLAVELMISLSSWDTDYVAVFNEIFEWAQSYYEVPIISFNVHLDEAFPHCHLLLLPLVNGRMNGSKLIGYKPKIAMMKKALENSVTKKYGVLNSENSLLVDSNKAKALEIINQLAEDPITKSSIWKIVEQQIFKYPNIFESILGKEVDKVLI